MFLLHEDWQEVLYGGAAGGGKSAALLMAALQHVDQPHYHALILRRTFPQLNKPEALIPLSKEWLMPILPRGWNEQNHQWQFPSGATLTFGHMDDANAKYDYQGAAYSFVGFDELTQFKEDMYTYLFSRKRRREEAEKAPTRIRATSNPGGDGHEWVKKRFVPSSYLHATQAQRFSQCWYSGGRSFIPAKLEDNPTLDLSDYERSMKELDPVTRAQLRHGDWSISADALFKKRWFRWYSKHADHPDYWFLEHEDQDQKSVAIKGCRYFITTDLATSLKTTADYTVIAVWADDLKGNLLLVDLLRNRIEGPDILPLIRQWAKKWNARFVGIESTGMQLSFVQSAKRAGLPVKELKRVAGEDKIGRATTAMIRMEQGQIWFPDNRTVKAPWLEDFEDELLHFDGDKEKHDDQVDVLSDAAIEMVKLYEMGKTTPPKQLGEAPRLMNPFQIGGLDTGMYP